ncbi:hypothetical protein [Desulfosporosinus sp. SB140]|uniref:hypothetical protein n=1 Tax=Desulfosporosinus paludis TaxID=3115649 RepID=UPI00388FEAFB
MPTYFIYPIYTICMFIITYLLVPRQAIRYLLRYSIVFGFLTDMMMVILFTKIIGLGGYINFGPFCFKGIPFFPLIAWTIYYVLYLYLLPREKPWIYIFPIAAAFFSVLFSNVLQNLGIFVWNWGTLIIPLAIYLIWHTAVTWAYLKISKALNDSDRLFT